MATVLLVFLAFATFVVLSISGIASTVEESIIANKNGVPEAWTELSSEPHLEPSVSSRVINNSYIEYTVSVKNTDSNHSAVLTHLSSYVKNGEKDGFIALDNDALEYSYSNTEAKSWSNSAISKPSNNGDGSKLSDGIYIGKGGSATDTVHFRFVVSPSEEGKVDDTISIISKSDNGEQKLVTTTDDIEYTKVDDTRLAAEAIVRENPTVARQDPNDESGEYTKPLGVETTPSSNIVSTSSIGAIFLSPDAFTGNIIIIVSTLGIIAVGLMVYLIARNKKAKK